MVIRLLNGYKIETPIFTWASVTDWGLTKEQKLLLSYNETVASDLGKWMLTRDYMLTNSPSTKFKLNDILNIKFEDECDDETIQHMINDLSPLLKNKKAKDLAPWIKMLQEIWLDTNWKEKQRKHDKLIGKKEKLILTKKLRPSSGFNLSVSLLIDEFAVIRRSHQRVNTGVSTGTGTTSTLDTTSWYDTQVRNHYTFMYNGTETQFPRTLAVDLLVDGIVTSREHIRAYQLHINELHGQPMITFLNFVRALREGELPSEPSLRPVNDMLTTEDLVSEEVPDRQVISLMREPSMILMYRNYLNDQHLLNRYNILSFFEFVKSHIQSQMNITRGTINTSTNV